VNDLNTQQYKEFQYELVKKLIKDVEFLANHYRTIPARAFSKHNSIILEIVYSYFQDNHTLIEPHLLKGEIYKKLKSESEAGEILDHIEILYADKNEPDENAVETCIKHVTVDLIIDELKNLNDKHSERDNVQGWINGLEDLQKMASTMISNMSTIKVVDFGKEFKNWAQERKDFRDHKASNGEIIRTGIDELDNWIPTRKGTVNSFLGRTKVGKSIILANLAFGAYELGRDVLIVILENSEFQVLNRLYSRAGYVNYKKLQRWDFSSDQENVIMKRMSCYENKMNKLWIFKGMQNKTNCIDLKNLLRILYEKYGSKIDLMALDYAQIFASSKLTMEKGIQDWKIHEQIIWELKELATEYGYDKYQKNALAIWTALQTNRGAWQKEGEGTQRDLKDVSVEDIAGGYNVIPALDNLVFINQNKDEKRNNILRLTPSIARDDASSDSNHIFLESAYEHMMINKFNNKFLWKGDLDPELIN
jgi:hypothetical protein